MWRGTARMRSSTRSSRMPPARSRSTSRLRVRADVMPMPRCAALSIIGDPGPHVVQDLVTGEVHLQRGDGDPPAGDGVEVGAGPGVLAAARRADPVDGLVLGIPVAHDRLRTMAKTEARDLHAL